MATFVFQNDEEIDLNFQPVNKVGEPAPIDGDPTWSAAPEGIVNLVATDDPKKMTVKSIPGATGTVTVEVMADADLGEGFKALTSTCNVLVEQSDAEGATFGASEPRART